MTREYHIAYGNSRMAKTWSNKVTTFDDLCERLAQTVRTTETAEEYPKLPKGRRDEIKDKGGFVAGVLKGGRRKKETVASRSMLTHDADHPDVDFIKKYEQEYPYQSCLYTTHGHTPESPRVRIITPLSRDVTPDEYAALSRFIASDLGIDYFDPCSYAPH